MTSDVPLGGPTASPPRKSQSMNLKIEVSKDPEAHSAKPRPRKKTRTLPAPAKLDKMTEEEIDKLIESEPGQTVYKPSPDVEVKLMSTSTEHKRSGTVGTLSLVSRDLSHSLPANLNILKSSSNPKDSKGDQTPKDTTGKSQAAANSNLGQQVKAVQAEAKDTAELVAKWKTVLASWDGKDSAKAKEKAAELIKTSAVPAEIRAKVWPMLIASNTTARQNLGVFDDLSKKDSEWAPKIARDLNRTYADMPLFAGTKGQLGRARLLALLKVFSLRNNSIGYCQGMNYVAAQLLLSMQGAIDDDIFWLFSAVISRAKDMYCTGIPAYKSACSIFGELLTATTPKLAAHFKTIGVTADMYTANWFIPLFCHPSIPLALTTRIWDSFLLDNNFEMLFRVGIALLQSREDDLLKVAQETAANTVASLADTCNPSQIIQAAFAIKLDDKILKLVRSV